MLVAGFLFATMAVFVKLGSEHFDAGELAFYRSAVMLVMATAIMLAAKGTVATRHFRFHLARGLAGAVSLIGYFYAIANLPLATAQTLNYTAPLFVVIATVVVLRERFSALLVVAVLLGFAGVVLLLQPTATSGDAWPALMGLGSGIVSSWAYLSLRSLGRAGEPDWRVVFWFGVIGVVLCGAWQLATSRFHFVTWEGFWILAGMGVSATLAQLAMTRAYRLGHTLVVSALSYSTLVFGAIATYLVWRQSLAAMEWAGMAVIIASGVLAMRVENRGR